jgi:hypothetical protein
LQSQLIGAKLCWWQSNKTSEFPDKDMEKDTDTDTDSGMDMDMNNKGMDIDNLQ